jgi:hypothetical protein
MNRPKKQITTWAIRESPLQVTFNNATQGTGSFLPVPFNGDSQAISQNAVSDGQRVFLPQSKQGSRRNTLCISRLTCAAMW